jgi:hypothetical protein
MCSEDVQASVASTQLKVLLVAPDNVIPPPSAEASEVLPSAKTMFLSSTVRVVELMVVVVPFIVKSPERVRLVPEIAPVKVAPDRVAYEDRSEVVARLASVTAVLNSAIVPLIVFVDKEIDLFVTVLVLAAVNVISVVSATVPVESGKVIVRSAVGSPAERVSSKSFAVEPSMVIVELNTPIFVMSERLPVVITVPVTSGKVIVLSAVGSVTDKVVS